MAKKNYQDFPNDDKKHQQAFKASQTDEESITGDTPDPESDDDMLENAHDMGLYKADDGAHPQELNLAGEVMKAEDNRRGLD